MSKQDDIFLEGYKAFRAQYCSGNPSVLQRLAEEGQAPETMVVACSDSRVDPAIILQCAPGDIFTVRKVANIVPAYKLNDGCSSVGAALEFGICYLKVKRLIIMGHSQCGGIQALLDNSGLHQDDFISTWVNTLTKPEADITDVSACSQHAVLQSGENCRTYPWLAERLDSGELQLSLWFFDIASGQIMAYSSEQGQFLPL